MAVIDGIKHCPNCGSDKIDFVNPHCKKCPVCGYEFYNNSIIGMCPIIFDDEGRLFTIRRAKNPGKGTLGLPGGFLDTGETLEEGLKREAKEEAGIDIEVGEYLFSITNTYMYRGIDQQPLDLYFRCYIKDMSNMKFDPLEVQEILFIKPEDIKPEDFGMESNQKAMKILFGKK